ncbi:MAG: VOC family protein [Xanthomonadaceae bacterium]|nr:VOC family protein [Xanthomonadaceae bacterium]
MHHSRLAGFIIDCHTDDLERAAEFWSAALGYPLKPKAAEADGTTYRQLMTPPDGLHIEVQRVAHESRVHLDIETDDIEAEVDRLEKLGAKKVAKVKTWVVMEAPTGQRFCVVRPQRPGIEAEANARN